MHIPMSAAALAAALVGALMVASCSDSASGVDSAAVQASPTSAASQPSSSSHSEAPAQSTESGGQLVERFQCVRCHAGTGVADVPRDKHCVSCHLDIASGKFEAPAAVLAGWKPHVMHLRYAPSLSGIGRLVRPAWAQGFLRRPFDLRPDLHPQMPRLALDEDEAARIALHLASRSELPAIPTIDAPPGDLERGRGWFQSKGCVSCHTFSGAGVSAPSAVTHAAALPDRALAPDLRHARERLIPEHLVAYILDPRSVKPDAAMPKTALKLEEAADLAAFVLRAPLDALPDPLRQARLPLLERPVGYDEVAAKVLHKICWHCHSQPDYARGDGGPGNTGGFGFAPRKLDLSSYESIAAGYLDRAGERRSLFTRGSGSEPVLVEVLITRQREQRGEIGDVRGMPLGLPPLSAEHIQLVESWVNQGHPR